jgi:NADH-quinone oxidoreductase subunit E
MADAVHIPDEAEVRAKWRRASSLRAANKKTADMYVARYPAGRQRSAVMALLDLAQRQVGAETKTQGWLPIPVIEYVAAYLDMPYMRAYEVATFYTMYNLAPVGRFHVQVCGTTPCMLRGSDDVIGRLQESRAGQGRDHARRPVHADRSRMPGRAPMRRWCRSTTIITKT